MLENTEREKSRKSTPARIAIRAGVLYIVKSYCIVFYNIKSSPAQSDEFVAHVALKVGTSTAVL